MQASVCLSSRVRLHWPACKLIVFVSRYRNTDRMQLHLLHHHILFRLHIGADTLQNPSRSCSRGTGIHIRRSDFVLCKSMPPQPEALLATVVRSPTARHATTSNSIRATDADVCYTEAPQHCPDCGLVFASGPMRRSQRWRRRHERRQEPQQYDERSRRRTPSWPRKMPHLATASQVFVLDVDRH